MFWLIAAQVVTICLRAVAFSAACLGLWSSIVCGADSQPKTIDVASRRQLFVDRTVIESLEGAVLKLHPPIPQEPVFVFGAKWEGLSLYNLFASVRMWRFVTETCNDFPCVG